MFRTTVNASPASYTRIKVKSLLLNVDCVCRAVPYTRPALYAVVRDFLLLPFARKFVLLVPVSLTVGHKFVDFLNP